MKPINFDADRTKRSPYSYQALQRIFKAHNIKCLECGICCNNPKWNFSITIRRGEDNFGQIRAAAEREPRATVIDTAIGFELISDGKRCAFEEQTGSQHMCKIYEQRPLICRMFPFLLRELDHTPTRGEDAGVRTNKDFVVLTTSCPLVKKARDAGITYVTGEDLFGTDMAGGYLVIKSLELPMLSESLYEALNYTVKGEVLSLQNFMGREIDGETMLIVPVY